MSPIPCRIILVDHASRRPLWEVEKTGLLANALMPLDPRPFALWDVSALATVFEIGPGSHSLLEALPLLMRLQWCKCRLCFTRDQQYVLVILEKKERTPVDVPAMAGEIMTLLWSAPLLTDSPTPWPEKLGPPPAEPSQRLGVKLPKHADHQLPPGLRTLVLVEDELMVRAVCVRILQAHFLVFEVGSSLDALALAERLPIPLRLLVSDISLPKMDGVTLARHWLERQPDARVLLLSGNQYNNTADSPHIAFLQKPFLAEDLVRSVLQLNETTENCVQA